MRISGNSLTESAWQLYQKNQSTPQETTFDDLLRSVKGDVQNATDPKAQIWSDYQAWKSQQPKRVLPDSKGATKENLAYLLEHFTGDKKAGALSLYQRMEAIDTMREMGIITEEQMKDCFGIGTFPLKTIDMNDPGIYVMGTVGDHNMSTWSTFFLNLPLMKASCLDDLFKLVDDQLRFTRAGDQAAEIREILERVRQEINE